MRAESMAASGQNGQGAVGEILKMRALTLKSKAGSKCWLTSPPSMHANTQILFLSLRIGVCEMK